MDRLFNMDSPVFVALGRLADLMILNIVFIITCLPVVTIGASCTAMSYVTLKFVKNEENYIVKSYLKSFKENFIQATIIWVCILAMLAILAVDFLILRQMGSLGAKMGLILTAVCIFLFMIYIYIFPVLSRFVNTCRGTVKNSFIMAVAHFPTTFILIVIDVAFVAATFLTATTFVWGTLFWLLCGFSTVSYLNSKFLVKVFQKYMPVQAAETESGLLSNDPEAYQMTSFKNLQPQPFEEDENSEDPQ